MWNIKSFLSVYLEEFFGLILIVFQIVARGESRNVWLSISWWDLCATKKQLQNSFFPDQKLETNIFLNHWIWIAFFFSLPYLDELLTFLFICSYIKSSNWVRDFAHFKKVSLHTILQLFQKWEKLGKWPPPVFPAFPFKNTQGLWLINLRSNKENP